MAILYKLNFASGKSYIGVAAVAAIHRYRVHKINTLKGSQCAIHCAWRKYGAPKLKVLAIVENHMLKKAEQKAIIVFNTLTPYGYNMTHGGDFNPMSMLKIRAKVKGKKHYMHRPEARSNHSTKMRGENNPMKRPKVAAKVSAALKNKPLSKKTKIKLRIASHIRWAKLEEHEKISASLKKYFKERKLS